MTAFQQYLNGIAGLLVILSFVPYTIAVLRGQTKPAKSTWIIWASLSILTAAGMYSADALNAQISAIAFGDVVVVLLAFKYGKSGWTMLDTACVAGAALGIVGWIVTRDPIYGIIIAMAIMTVGSIPTVVKTWQYPTQENPTAYALLTGSCIAQISAIPAFTVQDVLQPVTFLFIGGTILLLIFVRPRRFFVRVQPTGGEGNA